MTVDFTIPTLETDRLRLRAHRVTDLESCYRLWSNADVTRFIGGKPSTESQTWARILTYRGHWELMRFGYWLIEEKSSEHFVGEMGFADFKRDIIPSIRGYSEMGWALSPSMQNKGYALEAANAALAWGRTQLPSKTIVCLISPENSSSLKLAAKLNFQLSTRTTFAGEPSLLFTLAQKKETE